MILDSSAVVAVLCREPGHPTLIQKISEAGLTSIGSPTVFESAMVLTIKLRRDGLALVNDFLQETGIQVLPFTEQHTSIAFTAYLRYGKGRHPAGLNFGDCFSYATAAVSGRPLLFVGKDFSRTDVQAA